MLQTPKNLFKSPELRDFDVLRVWRAIYVVSAIGEKYTFCYSGYIMGVLTRGKSTLLYKRGSLGRFSLGRDCLACF